MANAHAAKERGFGLDINGKPQLPVVTTAGAVFSGSHDAAFVAAFASYPLDLRKSNLTFRGISFLNSAGYKRYIGARFRAERSCHANSYPPNSVSWEMRSRKVRRRSSARSRARRRTPPAP
jgi:hypothetical protein